MADLAETVGDVAPCVLFEILEGGIALVTLNRPAARNAINGDVTRTMCAIIARIEEDPDIRVAILASSHLTVFCAGADLAELARGNLANLSTPEGGLAGFVWAKRKKPWIAAIAGAALAGGLELALACDMIVAAKGSRFGLPEVTRGLFASAGGPLRLFQRISVNMAIEMVATGASVSAERALELGLINRIAEPGDLLDAATELARSIAVNAPLAVRESVAIIRRLQSRYEDEYRADSDQVRSFINQSEDAVEGKNAFLEKREPAWRGR